MNGIHSVTAGSDPIDIVALADSIQHTTSLISQHWTKHGIKPPTASSSSIDETSDHTYQSLVSAVTSATQALVLAVQGPKAFFQSFQLAQYDLPPWQIALEFKFFSVLPGDSGDALSAEEFSKATGVGVSMVTRVLGSLSNQGVFRELPKSRWAHGALSQFLAKNEGVQAALAMQMDEMYAASTSASDAIKAERAGRETTPFAERFGSPIYEFYKDERNADRSGRFGAAMAGAALLDSGSLSAIRASYPWEALAPGTIIDIGGGQGQLCLALAETNPHLDFLVQDIFPASSSVAESAAAHRVQFTTHDFFEPQPARANARAYIMKHCLHNHPDEKVVQILKNLVPALEAAEAGTPLLIAEGILGHERNLRTQERTVRRGDMCMWITLGARERSQPDFEDLLRRADPRLSIAGVWGGGVTKMMEVKLV